MEAVKGIPYGVARFEEVRNGNFYYVDKTMYLPLLEETGDYLSLNRPHGFGKSLFTSMMWAYYDMAQADKFDRMFGGLWVHDHPTPLKNAFQVIFFDFSLIESSNETSLAIHFNRYCGQVLNHFQLWEFPQGQDSATVRIYNTISRQWLTQDEKVVELNFKYKY